MFTTRDQTTIATAGATHRALGVPVYVSLPGYGDSPLIITCRMRSGI